MNEDVKKVVARILKDIQVEMSDEFDKNFERQAFFSDKNADLHNKIKDMPFYFIGYISLQTIKS